MAKAVTVVSKPVVEVTLTLSEKEAVFVQDLLAMVGGCPSTSRRKHSDAIYQALSGAGIYSAWPTASDKKGEVWFNSPK